MAKDNTILNTLVSEVIGFTEVATLTEAKKICRVSNTAEDDIITRLIVNARLACERYTGQSFVKKTATVELRNECGGISLPFGPIDVSSVVITVKGAADTTTDKYGLSLMDGFPQLSTATDSVLTVAYNCGYGTDGIHAAFSLVPGGVKDAVLAEVLHRWANRGAVTTTGMLCLEAKNLLSPFVIGLRI